MGAITKAVVQLYVVVALKLPGPKWQEVSEPIPRIEAVKEVQKQWNLGRAARLVPK
jgi:hypothetical protein